ncbi:MAG: hypothetical protein MZV49_21785 [Rhodopseudomonas palustris]|nr:hypothetical protein [Rhodopseudomonas palustris]
MATYRRYARKARTRWTGKRSRSSQRVTGFAATPAGKHRKLGALLLRAGAPRQGDRQSQPRRGDVRSSGAARRRCRAPRNCGCGGRARRCRSAPTPLPSRALRAW